MSRSYRLDGVPTIVVHGRYTVLYRKTMLTTTDVLIGEARKQVSKAKP
jgi:hypothetical protein